MNDLGEDRGSGKAEQAYLGRLTSSPERGRHPWCWRSSSLVRLWSHTI